MEDHGAEECVRAAEQAAVWYAIFLFALTIALAVISFLRLCSLRTSYAGKDRLLTFRSFSLAYAAAFFLLADHLQDAVNVCLNQIRDLQLAIAIARVYGGDNGPVLKRLLEEEVLAIAAQEGNRWLASWAFWMLGRRDFALRALIVSLPLLLAILCSSRRTNSLTDLL